MKGNPKLLETLNSLLADELTAVNQYMVHAEMAENWGYGKLGKGFEKRAVNEMKHAENLIARILFLDGIPNVSVYRKFKIGADVPKMLAGDHALEIDAVASYNKAIKLAGDVADYATREILEAILKDEDGHIDQIEELQDQIEQMTIQLFLTTQL